MRLPLNTLTGLALLCALGMSVPAALGTESFEQAKHGKFTTLSTKYGPMSCRDGVAEIEGENPGNLPCGCSAGRIPN